MKSQKTVMKDGYATITAVFPIEDNIKNASVAFTINGEKVKLNIDDFRRNSQSTSVSISPSNGIVITKGNVTLSTLGDMEIYLDGTKISEEEFKTLNPELIASLTVEQNNRIYITSK